jgi:hypothetical protein
MVCQYQPTFKFSGQKKKKKNEETFAWPAGKNHPAVKKLVNFAVTCY